MVMRLKLMAALICGGVAMHDVRAAAAERLVPNDNYSNAVSGPILFSDTKLVFLRLKQSLSLLRIAHDAPIMNGKQRYSADIYKVLEPTIVTYAGGSSKGLSICNLPEPRKDVTYLAKWEEDGATWIGLFIGTQTPTDTNQNECTGFTYTLRR
jgi:hypothetical protein